ncbi:MAG TPA: hypothetical protein VFZ83_11670 [Acidimicrobiia bacterium]|nr:hypothetical protein [Acidimicrobiia bacterium]
MSRPPRSAAFDPQRLLRTRRRRQPRVPRPRRPPAHEHYAPNHPDIATRRAELLARAHHVAAGQHDLACQMAEIREDLAVLRAVMWPELDHHLVQGLRHTTHDGPPPLPPPVPNATPIRGAALRYAALAVLADAHGGPLTLLEIHRQLHLRGYVLAGRHPVQQLADALAYEHEHGRAQRTRRGTYRLGELSPHHRRHLERPEHAPTRSENTFDNTHEPWTPPGGWTDSRFQPHPEPFPRRRPWRHRPWQHPRRA